VSDADEFKPAPGSAKPDNCDDYRHPEEHGHWDIEQIRELLFARDGLLDRIAALEAQLAEREWRPIETAPKNKVILISLRRKHGSRVVLRACWYGENELDPAESEHGEGLRGDPTHWQPLPPPPKETL
jgi:hypothetical protein